MDNGLTEIANLMAFNHVHKLRSMAEDTDQDWRLIAAERGQSEQDYIDQLVTAAEKEFLIQLERLSPELRAAMIDVLLVEPTKHMEEMEDSGPVPDNVIPFRRKKS